jgi:hypothetical protein
VGVDQTWHHDSTAAINHPHAFGGARLPLAIRLIRLPSTRSQSPPLNDLDFPSKSMKFVNTIGDVKLAGAARAPADEKSPKDASEAPPFEIKPRRIDPGLFVEQPAQVAADNKDRSDSPCFIIGGCARKHG